MCDIICYRMKDTFLHKMAAGCTTHDNVSIKHKIKLIHCTPTYLKTTAAAALHQIADVARLDACSNECHNVVMIQLFQLHNSQHTAARKWTRQADPKTIKSNKTVFPSKADRQRMRVYPVTWQKWRSHYLIQHSRKPYAAGKIDPCLAFVRMASLMR